MWETRIWFLFWVILILICINLRRIVDYLVCFNHEYVPLYIFSETTIIHIIFTIIYSVFYFLFYRHRRQTLFSYLLFVGFGLLFVSICLGIFPPFK